MILRPSELRSPEELQEALECALTDLEEIMTQEAVIRIPHFMHRQLPEAAKILQILKVTCPTPLTIVLDHFDETRVGTKNRKPKGLRIIFNTPHPIEIPERVIQSANERDKIRLQGPNEAPNIIQIKACNFRLDRPEDIYLEAKGVFFNEEEQSGGIYIVLDSVGLPNSPETNLWLQNLIVTTIENTVAKLKITNTKKIPLTMTDREASLINPIIPKNITTIH